MSLIPSTPSGSLSALRPSSTTTTSTQSGQLSISTPQQQKPASPTRQQAPTPPTPTSQTPGNWRHPRLDEIVRRKNANAFSKDHIWRVAVNVSCIALSLLIPAATEKYAPTVVSHALVPLDPYPSYALLAARAYFLLNIAVALAPLFRPNDTVEDIPLTPSQRQLLGLPPSSRTATPERWITPPRYSRSHSGTPRSSASASPLSARGSPLDRASGSPYAQGLSQTRPGSAGPYTASSSAYRQSSASPYSQSPLAHKAMQTRRRDSYGSGTSSLDLSEFEEAGKSGVPTRNAKASVQLNSKWLYEKGRGSPGQRGVFG